MNSKAEYNGSRLPRIVVEVGARVEQKEYNGDKLDYIPSNTNRGEDMKRKRKVNENEKENEDKMMENDVKAENGEEKEEKEELNESRQVPSNAPEAPNNPAKRRKLSGPKRNAEISSDEDDKMKNDEEVMMKDDVKNDDVKVNEKEDDKKDEEVKMENDVKNDDINVNEKKDDKKNEVVKMENDVKNDDVNKNKDSVKLGSMEEIEKVKGKAMKSDVKQSKRVSLKNVKGNRDIKKEERKKKEEEERKKRREIEKESKLNGIRRLGLIVLTRANTDGDK